MKRTLLLFLLPSLAFAAPDDARIEALSKDPHWRRLLHAKKTLFGVKSQVDGPSFFLSPRGKTDPAAELRSTLEGFAQGPATDPEVQHPQCRFPARYEWLREKLGDRPGFPAPQPCPRLDQWISRMNPGGLSLIYASSYMNNPASMYGHTFFRIEPAGERADSPLLAYSINFAADTPSQNGLVFAVKGLLGGYPGSFATHPYYMKVQQYSNMESRDLWEYRLNLSPAQVRLLLLHLWEMGDTWFDYYFFTENCSYQLLPLLEVVDPDLRLSDAFHFKAIPVDTLRVVLEAKGLASAGVMRPSQMRLLAARRRRLRPAELPLAEGLATAPESSPEGFLSLPAERQAFVLDSAHDLMRLRHRFRRYTSSEQESAEQALLRRRGAISFVSPDAAPSAREGAEPPESTHRTGRIGLGGGRAGGEGFTELSLRGATHDVEEDATGYVPGSRLEMIHPRFRYYDRTGRLALHRFGAVDILSLTPVDRWKRYPSWKIAFGLDTPLDRAVKPGRGLMFRLNGGSGYSWGGPRGMLYGMLGIDSGVGGTLDRSHRLAWMAESGILVRLARRAALHGTVFHGRYFSGEIKNLSGARGTLSIRLGDRWETRISASREGRRKEGKWMLQWYV